MQASSTNKNDVMLPVGGEPFWDQEDSEENDQGKNLKSISESFVLLKSLKQSRDRWLHSTFPKFSTKTRGHKAPEIVQPPHTIQPRGRCDIEIGPHLFPDTILYEVNYLSSDVPSTSSAPVSNTPSNPYWQSTAPYGHSYRYATPGSAQQTTSIPTPTPVSATNTIPSGSTPAQSERVPTPLITSLSAVSIITPSLISQVNAAAAADPIFSNLLQLAAAKTATEDQLQTLGLLIQSLAAIDHAKKIAAAASLQVPVSSELPVTYNQPPPIQTPVRPFDLVLEFRETPGDRWLFPRGTVCIERLTTTNNVINNGDILITICLSNDGKVCVALDEQVVEETNQANSGLYTATLRLKEPPTHIWDNLIRWIGGDEKNALCKRRLEDLVQPKRLYLGLRLPPGSLATQLQAACGPSYSMRPVRQGPAPQPRARQRKPYSEKKGAIKVVTGETISAKKARGSTSKAPALPIQCVSCKQTDVPLILGGRYCRPCVDSGKHNLATPKAPLVSESSQPIADGS
ncbi:hypothetical protein HYPSUDRAFT_37334 [Hypholoma sublateritium FD-334 SS-4]|uniref:Uncharacterized protein n=1 Tax=Hypholoma sublateritium (strain FD-334 SS-4) TaxID=945553 RepID=A0A0D2Q2R0_HYPSF|nr:hypothetical protein HYPSUDRAFT_37334 [Hypholoma sublateritium FD-334 SS-4]